ncbi:hypothetical protein E4U30_006114 [Claviceps sp. LM220 group G6]|nr:hypothetical protein E4U30_006114 [Claviceps sp. LM220 group G6]
MVFLKAQGLWSWRRSPQQKPWQQRACQFTAASWPNRLYTSSAENPFPCKLQGSPSPQITWTSDSS